MVCVDICWAEIEDRSRTSLAHLLEKTPHLAAYSCPLARRKSPRVMMDPLLMSVVTVLDRIMAKCGLFAL